MILIKKAVEPITLTPDPVVDTTHVPDDAPNESEMMLAICKTEDGKLIDQVSKGKVLIPDAYRQVMAHGGLKAETSSSTDSAEGYPSRLPTTTVLQRETADKASLAVEILDSVPLTMDAELEYIARNDIRGFLSDAQVTQKHQQWLDKQVQVRLAKKTQIKHWLQIKPEKPSFDACRLEGKLILLSPELDKFEAVQEIKIPYQAVVFPYQTRDEARDHLLAKTLLDCPNNSEGQQMLKAALWYEVRRRQAKENQGRRTDILPNSVKSYIPINSHKDAAAVAGVGLTKFGQFLRVWNDLKKPDHQRVLERDHAIDMIASVLREEVSVFSCYKKYKRAARSHRNVAQFVKQEAKKHGIRLSTKSLVRKKQAALAQVKDADHFNPSEGFENQIVCGDYQKVLPLVPKEIAELIIVSPEYNLAKVNYNGKQYSDFYANYLDKLDILWTLCVDKLVTGGRLAIVISSVTNDHLEDRARDYNTKIFSDIPHRIEQLNIGLLYRTHIVWSKTIGFNEFQPIGSIASPASPFIRQDHEFILIFDKLSHALKPTVPDAPPDITPDEYRRWTSSVWEVIPTPSQDHPAIFGSEIPKRLIKLFSFPGGLVLDACNGLGNTTRQAALLGRRWFGCDLEKEYCAIAQEKTTENYHEFLKRVDFFAAAKDPKDDSDDSQTVPASEVTASETALEKTESELTGRTVEEVTDVA